MKAHPATSARSAGTVLVALSAVLVAGIRCPAEEPVEVTGYRHDWTGFFPDARPETEWDLGARSNVLWSVHLPEWGHGSPLIVKGRLFVNAEPHTLLCIDPETGAVLWQKDANVFDLPSFTNGPALKEAWKINWAMRRETGRLKTEMAAIKKQLESSPDDEELKSMFERMDNDNKAANAELVRTWYVLNRGFPGFRGANWGELLGFTTATPVSDGRYVYVRFGTGIAAAFDMDGNCKWMVKAGFDPQATNASSPLIQDGLLIFHCSKSRANSGVRGGTYTVCALDVNTGAIVWETAPLRVPDWGSGSSLPFRVGQTSVVVTPSGDVIRSSDGKNLSSGIWGKSVASAAGPILAGSKVVMPDDSDGGCVHACSLETVGQTLRWKEVWKAPVTAGGSNEPPVTPAADTNGVSPKRIHPYCTSTPVYANDRIYGVGEDGFLWVLDAATGRFLEAFDMVPPDQKKQKVVIWSPLTVAGKHLFVFDDTGRVYILELGNSTRLVSVCRMEGRVQGAPLFWRNRMYLRAKEYLYCIGRKGP